MVKMPSYTSRTTDRRYGFFGKGSNSCRKQRRVARRSLAEAIAIEA